MNKDDFDLIVKLAGCSLATTPGKDNWVDNEGGLPEAICEMAKDIHQGGKTVSSAIAIAVSQAKKLAATSKDAKVRAKYASAVAQWEKMKASARGKDVVKATNNGRNYVFLSAASSFNTDIVRSSFNDLQEEKRKRHGDAYRWCYIDEVWTDFLIFKESPDKLYKVSYTVDAGTNQVTFGEPFLVDRQYVPAVIAPADPNNTSLSRIQEAAVKLSRGNEENVIA